MSNNLYGLSSKGKIKIWNATSDFSLNSDGHVIINIQYGYLDGQHQIKERLVKSGKNLNKKNQTTIEQQAQIVIDQLYESQIKSGYRYSIEELEQISLPFKPMLAHKYLDKSHLFLDTNKNFKNKMFAQRKLNGIRCSFSLKDFKFNSRTNTEFRSFPHIKDQLLSLNFSNTLKIDGELFSKDIPFEAIQSLVNGSADSCVITNLDESTSEYFLKDLEYHIYDLYDESTPNLTFAERLAFLDTILPSSSCVQIVETVEILSEQEMKDYFNIWISEGYEGLMLRDPLGVYKPSYRSTSLLKYKEMEQDEFQVIDIILAENDPLKVMFICQKDNNTFDCSLIGNKEQNYNTYYCNKDKYIGKYLSVNYQTLSRNGVPIFPVGQFFRDMINNDSKISPVQ